MEQPTANNQDTFIERVRLQGYKSIEDVEITFKPGLNILIGANGSGKTNFVEFLDWVLEQNLYKISGKFHVEVDYHVNSKKYAYSLELNNPHPRKVPLDKIEVIIVDDKDELKPYNGVGDFEEDSLKWFQALGSMPSPTYVCYSVSENFNNINNIAETEVRRASNSDGANTLLSVEPQISAGLYELINKILSPIADLPDDDKKPKLSFPSEFLENLSFYSPVKDIRLEENYRVEPIKNGKEILHVRFEFFVDGKWRPWTHLSDGTKRLVYIITEVTFANNIILLEEPELGIHPHQLSKLMDFLEAAAEHKQIILTTHSPQVLNVLRTNELDRIIVVRYEKDNGTKMSHLTEEEQEHARTYMEAGGLDLSDYWVHSSLEKETESV